MRVGIFIFLEAFLSGYRWYRRRMGGKWTRWWIDSPVAAYGWFHESSGVNETHRPGLGRGEPFVEIWPTRERKESQ